MIIGVRGETYSPWLPHIDTLSNSIYYMHETTNESLWSLPSGTFAQWREPAVGDTVILSSSTHHREPINDNNKVLGNASEQNRGIVVNTDPSPRAMNNIEVDFNGKKSWYNRYSLLTISTVAERDKSAEDTLLWFRGVETRAVEEHERLAAILKETKEAKNAANAALVAVHREPSTSAILEKTKCLQLGGRSRRRRFKSRRTKKSRLNRH